MSGTSSSSRSSTSGRGSRSRSRPERTSISSVSPDRSRTPRRSSDELADPLLVGPADDHGPHAVLHDLLQRDDLAGDVGPASQDHVEALVEHDLLAPLQLFDVDLGMERDAHLAPAGEDVDGAVVVLADHDAVRRRRLGQLVDLLAERGDVLARLAQGVGELLVLRHRLGQLALGLEESLLQRAHPLGGVGQLAAQRRDLFLERPGVGRAALRARPPGPVAGRTPRPPRSPPCPPR